MLLTVRDDILSALDNLRVFRQVEVWQGDLDELLGKAKQLPTAYVALAAGTFNPVEIMPPGEATLRMEWDVILFFNSLRDPKVSTVQGFGLIEAITAAAARGGLAGLNTAGGMLWPADIELLAVRSGVTAYRVGFTIEAEAAG